MRYKTVLLDWHGTTSRSLFWEHWASDARRQGDYTRLISAWSRAGTLLDAWMRGEVSAEEAVSHLARGSGLGEADLLQELELSCRAMRAEEAVLAAVDALRARGVRVLLATDNMDTFSRWTVPALELESHFDGVLDSSRLGALKDDREDGESPFYGPALESGLVELPALLVDDRPEARAAEELGVEVIVVSGPAEAAAALRALAASG